MEPPGVHVPEVRPNLPGKGCPFLPPPPSTEGGRPWGPFLNAHLVVTGTLLTGNAWTGAALKRKETKKAKEPRRGPGDSSGGSQPGQAALSPECLLPARPVVGPRPNPNSLTQPGVLRDPSMKWMKVFSSRTRGAAGRSFWASAPGTPGQVTLRTESPAL
ncbi:hypothetical protein P7K49_032507 [Saguinus oedipus]|uniref:Uncharacterized protein n=1 Tax=Saguinus oedipus TaxID=9490 RepID=A0ABQ9TZ45_SAGOE|nr:hypothetical protein P7K49_032507 [Saguinus oedipus]